MALSVREIHKMYEGKPLLRGVSFEVPDGETVCLLGPSGSGKSTLLRIITGLEAAESGQVLWDGADLAGVPVHQRHFGLMFQDYALYPHLTVKGNLMFPLQARRTPKAEAEKKVADVAARLGLEPLLKQYPRTLSGGQRQRVAVGRAWVRAPRLFLYDEPLSNLDAALRAELRQELLEQKKALGVTSLYVTHDQVEALTLADRLVVLKNGQTLQVGRPQEVYERPAHAFVAGFLGQPRMVLLPVRREGGRLLLCPPDQAALLAGTRPEHWLPATGAEAPDGLHVQAALTHREFVGATAVLTLSPPFGLPFFVTRPPGEASPEQGGWFAPADKLHLFDARTRLRLEQTE